MSEDTKRCPYCAEEILAAAKKCKHCGEFLDGRETPKGSVTPPLTAPLADQNRRAPVIVAICVIFGLVEVVVALYNLFGQRSGYDALLSFVPGWDAFRLLVSVVGLIFGLALVVGAIMTATGEIVGLRILQLMFSLMAFELATIVVIGISAAEQLLSGDIKVNAEMYLVGVGIGEGVVLLSMLAALASAVRRFKGTEP
jgi:hypothetical protein